MKTCSDIYIERLFDVTLLAIQLHVRLANDERRLARLVVATGEFLLSVVYIFFFRLFYALSVKLLEPTFVTDDEEEGLS